MSKCNEDCFNCIYGDCIYGENEDIEITELEFNFSTLRDSNILKERLNIKENNKCGICTTKEHRQILRNYYRNNRERLLKEKKDYYKKNRDLILKKRKANYIPHPVKTIDTVQAERKRQREKERYLANKEEINRKRREKRRQSKYGNNKTEQTVGV